MRVRLPALASSANSTILNATRTNICPASVFGESGRHLPEPKQLHIAARALRLLLLVCLAPLIVAVTAASAQNLPGILPFSTNENGVDLATGNVNFAFPLRAKQGKIPYASKIVGTSGMTYTDSDSTQFASLLLWSVQDPTTAQFGNGIAATGSFTCGQGNTGPNSGFGGSNYQSELLNHFTVTDSTGAVHALGDTAQSDGSNPYRVGNGPAGTACGPPTGNLGPLFAADGSGYSMTISSGLLTVYDRDGNYRLGSCSYNFQCSLGPNFYDPDGDSIVNQQSSVTDSLNTTVLVGVPASVPSGEIPPPLSAPSLSYTDASGASQQYSLGYTTLNLASNFSCISASGGQFPQDFGPQKFRGPVQVALLTSVTLPGQNAGQYKITYEPTPGMAGYYTGRVASIALPSGGSIAYSYSGGSQGINCTYATTPVVTAVINDNNQNSGTYTYASSLSTAPTNEASPLNVNFAVTKTDPAGNQTVYSFAGEYQTQVQFYQGQATGSPLKTVTTCYNGNLTNCVTPSNSAISRVSQTDVFTSYGSSASSLVETTYDPAGNVTSQKAIDYGNVGSGGACSSTAGVCTLTATTYGTWTGNGCSALGNISSAPCDVKVTNNNTGALVSETRYTYNSAGHATAISRWVSGGTWLTTNNTYDSRDNLSVTTDPAGNTITYSYAGPASCNGQMVTGTSYSVASAGSVSQAWNCNGGVLATSTDANGQQTAYTYNDPMWRLTSTSLPDGGLTTTTYNTGSSTPWTVSASTLLSSSGSETKVASYDGLGRTIQAQLASDPNGSDIVDTTYDAVGNVHTVSNPHRSRSSPTDGMTTYAYDALSRPLQQIKPDKTSVQWCYQGTSSAQGPANCSAHLAAGAGPWIDYTDELGHHSQRTGNSMGDITSVLEPDGNNNPSIETDYSYSEVSNLLQVDQWGSLSGSNTSTCVLPNGAASSGAACDRRRNFSYDGLSRLTTSTSPESGTSSYTYDAASNLHSKTDARGIMTTYGYDGLNRLTAKSYSDGTPSVSYIYDVPAQGWNFIDQSTPNWTGVRQSNLLGRLSYESNSNSTIVYGYDALGRPNLKSVCTPSTCGTDHYDIHATYDLAGNVIFADRGFDAARNAASPNAGYYYGGLTIGYNNASQLTTAVSDIVDANHPQGLLGAVSYTPLGGIQTTEFGSQYGQVFGYDPLGRQTDRSSFNLAGTTVVSDHWAFDSAGNVTEAHDSAQGDFTYVYDNLNRVTHANVPPFSEDYNYDNWGNQTAHTVTDGSSFQWAYMPTTQNRATNPGTSYDASGNMLADGLHTYSYDAENRVAAVTDQGVTYKYDPEGTRVATLSGGAVTAEYLYDLNGDLVTTVNNQGALVRAILRANRTHWGDYVGSAGPGGVKTVFRLVNQVGTLIADADTQGNLIEGCLSGPFGDGQICTSSYDYTEAHFADKLRDQETTNDYFGARYFNSTMGRFTSPDPSGLSYADPMNPQSLNLYSYALNNPLKFTDSTGLYCDYSDHDVPASDAGSTQSLDYASGERQFDYNSNQDECNLNGGAFVSDAYTHNGADDTGRPQYAVSAKVSSDSIPLSGSFGPGDFGNLTQAQFVALAQSSGFVNSPVDTALSKLTKAHPGQNMRTKRPSCTVHLNILPGTGQNNVPTAGNFHIDLVSPLYGGTSAVDPVNAAIHGVVDVIPDLLRDNGYSIPTGNEACK